MPTLLELGEVEAALELLLPQAAKATAIASPTTAVENTRENRTGNPQLEK